MCRDFNGMLQSPCYLRLFATRFPTPIWRRIGPRLWPAFRGFRIDGCRADSVRQLEQIAGEQERRRRAGTVKPKAVPVVAPAPRDRGHRPGTLFIREYAGEMHRVCVTGDGFEWQGAVYRPLSEIARLITGTSWSGPRSLVPGIAPSRHPGRQSQTRTGAPGEGAAMSVASASRSRRSEQRAGLTSSGATPNAQRLLRCAVYTSVSTEHGLDMEFNSLDAQREDCEAYIKSQRHERWSCLPAAYNDGGFSGGSLDRPDMQRLMADIRAGALDIVVVYKVDRLSRSLADFAKLVELFDAHSVSFVSVTQAFNPTSSMGRLTLNVLLSFAQFEREVSGERIRDKIAASKRKGIRMGGPFPLGYGQRLLCAPKSVISS
ncbi:hypothetical protein C3941_06295 [Kaistia algarum]|nr:hypothetical protein C3941_06295 [Kaistia algarum]